MISAEDDTKPIVLYINGGAYLNNFMPLQWKAIAEWAETTGCGLVTPIYPLLYHYTAKDAHPLMIQLFRKLTERKPLQTESFLTCDCLLINYANKVDSYI